MKRKIIKSKKAFTLVELMIAIGIVITLAALSISGILRARITASESTAIKTLKTLQAAFESYRSMNPAYPETFDDLCSVTPPYLDSRWQDKNRPKYSQEIQGYVYEIKLSQDDQYMIIASPDAFSVAGATARQFWMYQDGEIWDSQGGAVGAVSPN